MKAAPKDFKPAPRGREETSSDIAYLSVDMVHGQDYAAAMYQVNQLKRIRPRAWFCDIVHNSTQFGRGLKLMEQLTADLKIISPELIDANITVRMNHFAEHKFRARGELEVLLQDHQTKNVKWKGVDERSPGGIILT